MQTTNNKPGGQGDKVGQHKAMNTTENMRRHIGETVTIKWGVSRGRDSYGYTTCSLRNQRGEKIAGCNGGGYDMRGKVLGDWVARTFPNELCALTEQEDGRYFSGLCFFDPTYNPATAKLEQADGLFTKAEDVGKTLGELDAAGKIVQLDAIRAWYKETSKHSTERHTRPSIDGACGKESVMQILRAIGLDLQQVVNTSKLDVYLIKAVEVQAVA